MRLRTAIHASVWTARWDAEGIAPALDRAVAVGFDHVVVPLRRFEDIEPVALARAFGARGLVPLNTAGLPPDSDVGSPDPEVRFRGRARLLTAIGLARDMGSPQINGVLYGPIQRADGPASSDAIQASADTLRDVAEAAAAAGVRLALEIVNRYETNLLNTVDQALAYLILAGHSNLVLHLDTFHMSIEEADPIGATLKALPQLGYFELDQSHRGSLREGSLDLEGWLRRLVKAGYSGPVGIEAFSRSLMRPDHAAALAIWRDTFEDGDRLAREGLDLIRRSLGQP